MQPLTTKQLLQITPLEDSVRQNALAHVDKLTVDERFHLEQICWETLADICDIRVQARFEEEVTKAAKDGLTDPISMEKLQDEVMAGILAQIDKATTSDELAAIRASLQQTLQHKPSQPATPPSTPSDKAVFVGSARYHA